MKSVTSIRTAGASTASENNFVRMPRAPARGRLVESRKEKGERRKEIGDRA